MELYFVLLIGLLLVGCAGAESTAPIPTATIVESSLAATVASAPTDTPAESRPTPPMAGPTPAITATMPPQTTEVDRLNDEDIQQMAADFKRLRPTPGQFDGGTWNNDVDQWLGRKHKLMLELGTRLAGGDYDEAEIVQLLGPPDLIERSGDPYFELVTSQPGAAASASDQATILIYYWRGTHDFLYFVQEDGTVVGSDWWMANE